MSDIEYQRIELHATDDLLKEQDIIEYEKETVQRLMMENQINFTMQVGEDEEIAPSGKTRKVFVLNLIVRKDDVDRVVEILDKEGNFGYYIDLDEKYNPEENEAEEPQKEETISFVEETKEDTITESINDEDPIKIYGEDNGNVTIEFRKVSPTTLANLIMKGALIFTFLILYIMEIGIMIYLWNSYDYETITSMVVAMIIQTPIFIWIYNILNKKKK